LRRRSSCLVRSGWDRGECESEVHEDRRTNRHEDRNGLRRSPPGEERIEGLPESVLEALGELAGAAKEGLLAVSVGVGLGVLHELLEAEV
jgi:hypothetical protein